jgi:hypothetical protein
MMRDMRRPLLTCLLLLLLSLTACASDKKDDKTAASTILTTSTSSVATGSVTSSTAPAGSCPDTLASSSPPPSQGSALADGRSFGFIKSIGAGGSSIAFDVAQLFTGDAAVKAAAEDGGDSPPDNDYWIRNNSPATRTLAISGNATLCIPTDPGQPTANKPVKPDDFGKYAADGEPNAAWIDVRSGNVVRVDAQFFP